MDDLARSRFTTDTFQRVIGRFGQITEFRLHLLGFTSKSLPSVVAHKERMFHSFVDNPENAEMWIDKDGVSGREWFRENLTKMALEQGVETVTSMKMFVDAACFVFAHSVLDDAVSEFLRFAGNFESPYWSEALDSTSVRLGSTKGKGYAELLAEKKQERLKELLRRSLLERIDTLLKVIGKIDGRKTPKDFDLDRLAQVDQIRHELVHRAGPIQPLPKYEDDVWLMNRVFMHLLSLVAIRFNAKLNPYLLVEPKEAAKPKAN